MLRDISPHAIAYASFCKPHDLRLWRSQGFLDGVGERQGKGHLYSIADAVQIRASILLARCNVLYRDAFDIVAKYRPQIQALDEPTSPTSQHLALIVAMHPVFDDQLVLQPAGPPYAQMVFEENELARAMVNLSDIASNVAKRVNDYQARQTA